MDKNYSSFPFQTVSQILNGILHGKNTDYDRLYELTDSIKSNKEHRTFLQLISTLVIKTEVAEFRLETMISDLLQAQAKLSVAELDPLTKLPNRAVFNDELHEKFEQAKSNNNSLGLMFIDLDKFKQVNDSMGHDAGDEILQLSTERMSRHLRDKDLLSRLGGDEFTILLPGIDSYESAAIVANRIRESIAMPFNLKNGLAEIGSSIGISLYPNDCDNAPALLKNADIAMYSAKESGRNRVITYPNRHQKTS